MQLTNEVIEKYLADGLIRSQVHPIHDIRVLNYSAKTQYEKLWDEVTLLCRGLCVNGEGQIVGRGLPKFFNLSELKSEQIPDLPFEVFTKEDGSYIQIFWYQYEWVVASKGSFTSVHADLATQIATDKNLFFQLDKANTYVFELIHPDTRIVVDYGDVKDLILLAVVETATGNELDLNQLNYTGTIVERHPFTELSQLGSFIKENTEGFVVKFSNGFRMKIKSDEYVKLHVLITSTNSNDIFAWYCQNADIYELMEKIPDEIYNWCKAIVDEMEEKYEFHIQAVINGYTLIKYDTNIKNRKQRSLAAQKHLMGKYFSQIMSMLDGNYKDVVFSVREKYCEPKFSRGWGG